MFHLPIILHYLCKRLLARLRKFYQIGIELNLNASKKEVLSEYYFKMSRMLETVQILKFSMTFNYSLSSKETSSVTFKMRLISESAIR